MIKLKNPTRKIKYGAYNLREKFQNSISTMGIASGQVNKMYFTLEVKDKIFKVHIIDSFKIITVLYTNLMVPP